jgi:hypothetical protein
MGTDTEEELANISHLGQASEEESDGFIGHDLEDDSGSQERSMEVPVGGFRELSTKMEGGKAKVSNASLFFLGDV